MEQSDFVLVQSTSAAGGPCKNFILTMRAPLVSFNFVNVEFKMPRYLSNNESLTQLCTLIVQIELHQFEHFIEKKGIR